MENTVKGKNILIVQGSLLAGSELRDALVRAGAHAYLTCNLISAFELVQKHRFDGAVIDRGLHNEAFDLCAELQDLGVPYVCCAAPHRLQGLSTRERDADHAVWKLGSVIAAERAAEQGAQLTTTRRSNEIRTQ